MYDELPPDPEEMNDKRALAARRALLYFARDFGETDDRGELAELAEQNITDLLVDLAHYCDRENLLLRECILRAGRGYAEETKRQGMQFSGQQTTLGAAAKNRGTQPTIEAGLQRGDSGE